MSGPSQTQEEHVDAVHELSTLLMSVASDHQTQLGAHGAMTALLAAYGRLLMQNPRYRERGLQALASLAAMVAVQAAADPHAMRH